MYGQLSCFFIHKSNIPLLARHSVIRIGARAHVHPLQSCAAPASGSTNQCRLSGPRSFVQLTPHSLICSLPTSCSRLTGRMLQEGDGGNAAASVTEALFGGALSSQVVCGDCGHKAVTQEPFYNLSLPVPSKLRGDARSASSSQICEDVWRDPRHALDATLTHAFLGAVRKHQPKGG